MMTINHLKSYHFIRSLLIYAYLYQLHKLCQEAQNQQLNESPPLAAKEKIASGADPENQPNPVNNDPVEIQNCASSPPIFAVNLPRTDHNLQTDPMGYQDSMNLYQAFNMNPINFLDPLGLETLNEYRRRLENELFDYWKESLGTDSDHPSFLYRSILGIPLDELEGVYIRTIGEEPVRPNEPGLWDKITSIWNSNKTSQKEIEERGIKKALENIEANKKQFEDVYDLAHEDHRIRISERAPIVMSNVAGFGIFLAGEIVKEIITAVTINKTFESLPAIVQKTLRKIKLKRKLKSLERLGMWSSTWKKGNLQKAIAKFAGESPIVYVTETGKIVYRNAKTGIEVWQDYYGGYYRIRNSNLNIRRNWLDLEGNILPNNVILPNGKQRGMFKSEYNELTHFLIQ